MEYNNNYPVTANQRARYEPHELEEVVDPIYNGHSKLWHCISMATIGFEVLNLGVFIAALNRDILFKAWVFNIVHPISAFLLCAVPLAWYWYAGSQKRLDENVNKIYFKKRVFSGLERFSKYEENHYTGSKFSLNYLKYLLAKRYKVPQEEAVRNITGILNFDPETCLSEHMENDVKWSLSDHPYLGTYAYDVIAYVNFTDDEEVIIESLFELKKTLKDGGTLIRTVMYTGETICNVLDDIERQLKEPDLSDVREKALYSVYNHYVGRDGNYEPMYLMHFGLPTTRKSKAIELMNTIRTEFEDPLNALGIKTVLIPDSDIMETIMNGIFSGMINITGELNEY